MEHAEDIDLDELITIGTKRVLRRRRPEAPTPGSTTLRERLPGWKRRLRQLRA